MSKTNIYLIGPMGAGKTTIGRLLSKHLGRTFKDSDHEIEDRCGADIPWIFDVEGEAGFRKHETAAIADLTTESGLVLATGGGVVTTPENCRLLSSRGTVVYLETSIEHQLQRTSRDRKRPLLQNDNPRRVLTELLAKRDPLYRECADIVVSTKQSSPQSVVHEIIRLIDQDS